MCVDVLYAPLEATTRLADACHLCIQPLHTARHSLHTAHHSLHTALYPSKSPQTSRGRIRDAVPPSLPQWYYMAQVQGLLDIFQRDWCNLFVWTPNAAALFHLPRDAQYWALCFEVLAEFWWEHVIPARHALEQGGGASDVEQFRCVYSCVCVCLHFPLCVCL